MLVDYIKLLTFIKNNATETDPYLIGIDGPGASGKSHLAKGIQSELPNVQIVHFDDFYKGIVENANDRKIGNRFDWIRLQQEVLVPLINREATNYQIYDWELGKLTAQKTLSPHGIIAIEGVYSTRTELRHFYNLTIFVYAEYNERLRRGIEGDGMEFKAKWVQEWMPEEIQYMDSGHRPRQSADIVINGNELIST